ncbi:MAG: hypothetical protein RRZ73_05600 [Oscillospiraceae bacterium]
MLAECWTIVAIISMMSFMFMCTKKREMAIALLPLLLVPLLHISAGPVVRILIRSIQFPYYFLVLALDIIGLVVSSIAIGVLAGCIKHKALKNFYIVTCGGFSLILDLILLYNTVGKYLS